MTTQEIAMYTAETAALYDEIYTRMKNYGDEAEKIRRWITKLRPEASLLDVACGTAEHAKHLKAFYQIDGLDLSAEFVAAAQRKNPEGRFVQGDMTNFDLGRTYDVVTCLFSSIGYVLTPQKLAQTIACLAKHLAPRGILLVEPWFTPEHWQPGLPHMVTVNEPELKVARINISETRAGLSYFKLNYLLGTPAGVQHFTEEHTLGLFTVDEMKRAFASNGLRVQHDLTGLFGGGLYLAERP